MKIWKIVGIVISAVSMLIAAAKSLHKFVEHLGELRKKQTA
jgi:hypothetical protein